ncbi:MAG: tRNA pseudouridine(13) synthase TruD [Candidatus Omnitrophica bacterium]|nr:tRNA pseudouridine(13) synthase TruD [Candidatus Omnitrophota bacterium]
MKLTIKARPEDFLVTEIASILFASKGAFGVYLLKKSGWNTVELIRELSRKLNLPRELFSYGGRKDRYSQSTQYITVKSPKRLELREDKYSLKFLGFMNRPMGPDLIEGNSFEVVVRKLSAKGALDARAQAEAVASEGFPNYFDDQRFGSFDERQGFLAQKLLRGEFNGALKIYLTSVNASNAAQERRRKQYFFEHWRDWAKCFSQAKTICERECFAYLVDNPTGFTELLRKIPAEELATYFSAYQAHLWNDLLRRLITSIPESPFKTYPGIAGDYLFYIGKNESIENLILDTSGAKFRSQDKLIESLYHEVLVANGIKQAMFNKLKTRQAFFKSFSRKAVVIPEDFSFEVHSDELYPGKKKFILKFRLPRGSFATMLVKSLFS